MTSTITLVKVIPGLIAWFRKQECLEIRLKTGFKVKMCIHYTNQFDIGIKMNAFETAEYCD